MLFNKKQILPPTDYLINFIDGTPVLKVDEFKYLGLLLHSQLSFRSHIDLVIKKISYRLKILYFSINCFTRPVRKRIITQLILPILDNADIIYQTPPIQIFVLLMLFTIIYVDLSIQNAPLPYTNY